MNGAAIQEAPSGTALGAAGLSLPIVIPAAIVTNSWKSAVSGDWDTASNWSLGHVPTAMEDAVINLPGTYTVTHSLNDADAVNSLVSVVPFTFSAGSLNVTTTVQVDNTFTLNGGTLINGTVLAGTSGQGVIATSSGGTLNDVTLNGNLNLTSIDAFLTITNGLTLNGTATLGGDAYLGFSGTQTLGGTGAVLFDSTSYPYYYNALVLTESNTTLTIGTGMTIEGGTTVGVGYSQIGGFDSAFGVGSNSGTQINDLGTIKATVNGTLTLAGTFTGSQTLDSTNGAVVLTGTLANDSLTCASGSVLTITPSGATLSDVVLNGNLNLTSVNAFLTITNGLTLNGTATLDGDAYLGFSGTQTLGGTGAVLFNSTSYPYYYNALVLTQSNTTLTIGTGMTIEGGTTVGVGYSQIGGFDSAFGIGSNSGTQIDNLGTIEATANGTLTLAGTFTGSQTLDSTNGAVVLTGVLANDSLTCANGSALTIISSGAILSDVVLTGNLNLTAVDAFLTITNGLTLDGTMILGGDAYLGFSGTQMLAGTGAVEFDATSYPYYYNALVLTLKQANRLAA
jgi:hypothetical protein